jgi:cytochrome P450
MECIQLKCDNNCFIIFIIGLSREEVMGLILSFLSAGYSITATVLAWFIHMMSKHPQVQAKIKKELAEYNLQRLSNEQLDSLVYLDCVIREVFRFIPIAMGSLRTLTADDRLPKSGFQLKKGEHVFIPFYNLARDPRYWSDPDQFYPERFLNESEAINNNKAALIPFGGGHRQCSGQDLARLEVKAICARFMQHVTFVDGGPAVNSGGYQQIEAIRPKHIGVVIKFD